MGYRKMEKQVLYNIYRRYSDGQNLSRISEAEETDRKTVRTYIRLLDDAGLTREKPMPTKAEFFELCDQIVPERERIRPVQDLLSAHADEIEKLIKDAREPVKPKTAFNIVVQKYGLNVGYGTYKRFIISRNIIVRAKKTMLRIEMPPGMETQMDYGRVGMLIEPTTGRLAAVWAFIATLVHSRLPFVQFVRRQTQASFTASFIDMFEFFDGVTQFITIDNLKTGVTKPDLYDPRLNIAFSELIEHYGSFVNPARVGTPTDKAKVERMVPVARELFLELKHVHPGADLAELNRLSIEWSRTKYGRRPHGTTGIAPMQAYEETERSSLKKLPEERFEVPIWKTATVHPDQFVQFEKKHYSLPVDYRGREVMIKKTGQIVHIFSDHRLIRQYAIPKGHRAYDRRDFPDTVSEMMEGEYPSRLLTDAAALGPNALALIDSLLKPHAYLNARRAQGMLHVLRQCSASPSFDAVCLCAREQKIFSPKMLKAMFENDERLAFVNIPRSPRGEEMLRGALDYFN